jgi:hypothetical protein
LHGHHGGIYQAGNWIYCGETKGGTAQIKMPSGKIIHKRTAMSRYGTCKASDIGGKWTDEKQKHKYLMPLDAEMKKQILPLAKTYPKRAQSIENDAPGIPAGGGRCESDLCAPLS